MSCASKTRASNSCWAKPSWRRRRCESWQRETSRPSAVVGLLLVAFAPHHLFAVAARNARCEASDRTSPVS